jgi:hypothetical protein
MNATTNTMRHSARKLLILWFLSVGPMSAPLAQVAEPHLAGPRNTIPTEQAQRQNAKSLRSSTDGRCACKAIRIEHHGHPAKGFDGIQATDVPCERSRLSER